MKRKLLAIVGALALAACSDVDVDEDDATSTADATDCTAADRQFMKDSCKKKVQPSNRERSLTCPVVSTDARGFAKGSEPRVIDDHALDQVAPFDPKNPVRVVGVIIRRVAGVPYYQYVSNGTEDEIVQAWSSSKFMAAMAAASSLRAKSDGQVGLTATVDGKPLGDLVTDIASYENKLATSNGTARYFKNVAGREYTGSLVTKWLGRTREEFRGGYGTDLAPFGYTFKAPNGSVVSVPKDDRSGITNVLSMLTVAESLKRLAVWDDAATRVPELEAVDVKTILYGAEDSVAYPDQAGGLMRDPSIYMQNAIDIAATEKASRGKWRIFGKLGYGEATRDRLGYVAELVHVAYGCLPVLDQAGAPVPDQGAELVLAIHGTNKSGRAGDIALNKLYRRIVQEVMLPRAHP